MIYFVIIFFCLISVNSFSQNSMTTVTNLKCEYRTNPIGIDVKNPRLSWNIGTDERNWIQTSYQIIVASDISKLNEKEADIWNSGKTESSQNINIKYNGKDLTSHKSYYWSVRVWSMDGSVSDWSKPNKFVTGIFDKSNWKAEWIKSDIQLMDYQKKLKDLPDFGMESEADIWSIASTIRTMTKNVDSAPAVYLRKEFECKKEIVSAYVSICGLGLNELYINNERVGDEFLNPAPSDYSKRIFYSTYDITNNLKKGNNAVGVILGNGWYNLIIPHGLRYYAADYINPPQLMLTMTVKYSDGSMQTISTDNSWKFTTDGPIRFNCLLGGETYDANQELNGWSNTGYDSKNWKQAIKTEAPAGKLYSQQLYPVRKTLEVKPKSIIKNDSLVIVDFGEELTGWCRIKLKGKKGREITITYPGSGSHTLGRYQTHKYIFKGEGEETYEPRFSYNGFQKIELSGLDYKPEPEAFTGVVVVTDMPQISSFKCSNDKISKLQEISLKTIRNYVTHIPNDPTREKAGWTQDVENAFDVTAYSFDSYSMYNKWMNDFLDIQHENGYVPPVVPGRFDGPTINGPWWGGMIAFLPSRLYEYYADEEILKNSYPAIKKYVDYLSTIAKDNIVEWGLGDWLEPGSPDMRPKKTPVPVTSTIAYYNYAKLTSDLSQQYGNKEDVARYAKLAEQIKKSYNEKFFNKITGEYALGSQASQLLSLHFGLVPDQYNKLVREALLKKIAKDDYHLNTGFVSTPFLLTGLTDLGYPDIAYTIATQNTYPSWFDMVFGHGNSVFKENWEGGLVQMPSLAGSIGWWFYYSIAGIQPDKTAPGFKTIIINPLFNKDLTWAKGEYQSIYGKIVSDWKIENGKYTLSVEVPANTTAKVYLPVKDVNKILESGKPIKGNKLFPDIKNAGDKCVVVVGSGKYYFEATL
jgi:alpha-L-rhamnosidase